MNKTSVVTSSDWLTINLSVYDNLALEIISEWRNNFTEQNYYKYFVTHVIAISFMVGVLILATIAGNVFVLAAILTERSLKIVPNYLILSLAITDLLVAILVMPISLMNELSTKWIYGNVVCDLWTSMDILCCTASILHLVAISGDRYLAVSNIDYTRKRNRTRILTMIFIVWLVSGLISIPPLFGWRNSEHGPEITGNCIISQDLGYTVYSTVCAFYFPLLLMIILNIKIYNIAKYRIRKRYFQKGPGNNGFQMSSETLGPTIHNDCSTACPGEMKELGNHKCESGNEITVIATAHESRDSDKQDSNAQSTSNSVKPLPPEIHSDEVCIKTNENKVNFTAGKSVTFKFSLPKTRDSDKFRRERLDMKRERRAAKVLAIITSAFVVCWLPFFIVALLAPFCKQYCHFPGPLTSFFLWLGYVNSLVNPIIYTIFNPHFRKAFNKILFVRFLKRTKHLR